MKLRSRPRKRFVRKFLRPPQHKRSIRSRVHKPFWDALMQSMTSPTPGEVAMSALGTLFSNGAPPETDNGTWTLATFSDALLTDKNYDAIERLCTNPDGSRFAPPGAGLRAQTEALVSALTPREQEVLKERFKPTLTGGAAQRGWLAEDGVWPAGEKAKHAWDHWDDDDRATEREGLKKP